ncbi:hypothetical protein IMZ31_22445 (plasmid) [Pontibacillus sp. ALD_SL1]|uniref:hypothetical protein n=1 Tax=Pontibacillus sp. ALD_SL1 TaxID=2777185 RepID=UPI001A964FBF|nr:hypothetical protein [Pontibacillus sp. ALD_SL1]QST02216.1 hypothetical protein IMZ31_22445 [Pontibacillus sp. ALD_SL1]
MSEWIKQEENEWLKQVGEHRYTVVGVTLYEDEYRVHEVLVDLEGFTEETLVDEMNEHGLTPDFPKGSSDWKQLAALSIAEQTPFDREYDEAFQEEEEVELHLKDTYGITMTE